jgi:hypothetical protein
MPIKPDEGLTPDEWSQRSRHSVPGMAYFAGTAPRKTFCDNCTFFSFEHVGHMPGARCAKYRELTGKWHSRPLPPTTPACKYFEPVKKRQHKPAE